MSGFWKWGFRASIKLHTAPEDESIKINQDLTLNQFLAQDLPLVDTSSKLWLHPLLFNGSLQTLYYAMHKSHTEFQVYYGRELFQYKDGGQCSLDWIIPKPESKEAFDKISKESFPESSPRLHPKSRFFTTAELEKLTAEGQTPDSTDPICVVSHGLAGGSHEPLIRNLGKILYESDTNWDVVVVNNRGCCRTKITTGQLFNALTTEDIKDVLVELRKRYPSRPIYAVGFSFGAVMLANFLGEAGEEAQLLLKGACLIGCPWDLAASARHLDSSITGHRLFGPSLAQFLSRLVKSNLKELRAHLPALFSEENVQKALEAKTTADWDNVITCKTAGFDTVWDYYEAGSPQQRMSTIAVPTLIINSTDDPAVDANLPIKEVYANPHLAMVESDLGGHLGFVKYSGDFWCVQVADEFFQSLNRVLC